MLKGQRRGEKYLFDEWDHIVTAIYSVCLLYTSFLEKSWFIRCRNITLGYTLPVKSAKKLVSNVRIYADVNNLFTITPYDGLDVETDDSYWAYPNVRSFSIGLDITF